MYSATLCLMPGAPWLWLYAPTLFTSFNSFLARAMTSSLYPKLLMSTSSLSSKRGFSNRLATCRKKVMGFWSSCWGFPMLAEMTVSKGRSLPSPLASFAR